MNENKKVFTLSLYLSFNSQARMLELELECLGHFYFTFDVTFISQFYITIFTWMSLEVCNVTDMTSGFPLLYCSYQSAAR